MSKEEVEKIKKNRKDLLRDTKTWGVKFGSGDSHIKYDPCFARLMDKIKEMESPNRRGNMQYILYYDEERNLFDYNSLFKQLKVMFGNYFKILRCKSGYKLTRIIDINEIRTFKDYRIRYCAFYLLFILLRALDSEYSPIWRTLNINDEKLIANNIEIPFKRWQDIIYVLYAILSRMGGHGINDNFMGIKYNEKLLKNAINNYVEIITKAFGDKFDFTEEEVVREFDDISNIHRDFRIGQSTVYSLIERVVKAPQMVTIKPRAGYAI